MQHVHLTPIRGHGAGKKIVITLLGISVRIILNPATFILRTARKPRVRVAVRQHSHVLLVKSITHPLTWDLPGGGYNPGESGAQCAARELSEELAISIRPDNMQFLSKMDEQKTFRTWHYDCYSAALDPGTKDIRPNFELLDAAWFPVAVLPERITTYTRELLNR